MVSFLVQFGSKVGIVAWYNMNKDYITRVLCINKDNPEKKCDGKCQLMQRMSETENESTIPVQNQKGVEEFWTFFEEKSIHLSAPASLPRSFADHKIKSYTQPALSIFHPPC